MGGEERTTMRHAVAFLTLATAIGLGPAAAEGQDYRFGAHWNAGGTYFTPLNSGGAGELDIELDPGWIAGLQFEQWLGSGRFGWRVNGAISRRPLSVPGEKRNIGLWLADIDLLARLMPADPARMFNIFVSAGVGAIQYRLGDGEFLTFANADAAYDGNDAPRLVGAGGLGVDFLTGLRWDGDPVGIRVEVVDHVALRSPFEPLSGGDFSPIHNVRLVLGAFTGWGLLR
jgi:hypothetical protein